MSDDTLRVLMANDAETNPYNKLLTEGLEENGLGVFTGTSQLLLPLFRTVLRHRRIDVIQLGWLYEFYTAGQTTESDAVNTVIALGRTFWFLLDLLIVKLLGVRLVWTIHNKYHHEKKHYRIEELLNIIVGNMVDAMTVKCESAKETIIELYRIRTPSKVAVIPDGNYIDWYPNNVSQAEARSELDISSDEFVYLFFGQIRPYKGVLPLIDTFKQIRDTDSSLWIVGKPKTESHAEQIRKQSAGSDSIHLRLEFIDDDSVQYYMNAADVLVFPYRDILNSGSVYLGMSFGKPIIAPAIGCIPELFPAANSGLLYEPTTRNSLGTSLSYAGESADLRSIGKENYRTAQTLTWHKQSSRYADLYQEVTT